MYWYFTLSYTFQCDFSLQNGSLKQRYENFVIRDIQKLKALDLRETLQSNSESTGGIRADFVSKVYPLSSGENWELLTDVQDLEQNQSDFKYEAIMVRISAFGWSSDLRNLPEMNFIQLYDYPVSKRKYRYIVLRGTHYEKLKSYQFSEGNVKKLESKIF